jgi:RNA polymerase sigma-70 factor (ECF subfamily)
MPPPTIAIFIGSPLLPGATPLPRLPPLYETPRRLDHRATSRPATKGNFFCSVDPETDPKPVTLRKRRRSTKMIAWSPALTAHTGPVARPRPTSFNRLMTDTGTAPSEAPVAGGNVEVPPHAAAIVAVGRFRDRRSFRTIFEHFGPRLKAYFQRQGVETAQAEDIVQDVMVTVWRKAATFDPARASAAAWIFAIARNRRIDIVRKERRPLPEADDPAIARDAPASPEFIVTASRDGDRLRDALATLPPAQAEIIALSYFEDLPQSEVARRLDLPLGTVKSRVRLGLERLRAALGNDR